MLRYAISDRHLNGLKELEAELALIARCGKLADSGVDFILAREKDLAAGELCRLVRGIVAATQGKSRVLVSGRADVALAAGAAGVHLSSAVGELTAAQVRAIMPGAYVSISCHTLAQVKNARDVNAVLFAPVFGKVVGGVEVQPGIGLAALQQACQAASQTGLAVFALGGITAENASQCIAYGASGVAAIRMFFAD